MKVEFDVYFDEDKDMILTSPIFSLGSEMFEQLSNRFLKIKIDHWLSHDEWGEETGIENKVITIETQKGEK